MSLTKPDQCQSCRLCTVATGYVPDTIPAAPKVAVVLPQSTKDAVLQDKHWFPPQLLAGSGLKASDLLLCAALRCGAYDAKETDLRHALDVCRQYDSALSKFNPNLAIVTVDLIDLRKTPAYRNFLKADFRRAHEFYTRGYRVVMLMGSNAIRLVAPWADSVKWRGHWWELPKWPYEVKEEKLPWEI